MHCVHAVIALLQLLKPQGVCFRTMSALFTEETNQSQSAASAVSVSLSETKAAKRCYVMSRARQSWKTGF